MSKKTLMKPLPMDRGSDGVFRLSAQNCPTLYGCLSEVADDMNLYDGIAYKIIDIATWLPLIQGLFQLFTNCPKKKNPTPTPPPASGISQESWDKAWESKNAAERGYRNRRHSYKRPMLARMIDQVKSDAQTSGNPVTDDFAASFAAGVLDQSREQDMAVLAKSIEEAHA